MSGPLLAPMPDELDGVVGILSQRLEIFGDRYPISGYASDYLSGYVYLRGNIVAPRTGRLIMIYGNFRSKSSGATPIARQI